MRYRCPYCHADLGENKPSACPSCGKQMRAASARTPEEQRTRRRARYRIHRDALAGLAKIRAAPDPRALYGPRVLLGAVIVLACLGSLLIGLTDRRSRAPDPGIPHRRALRELDVLATALGRYRFHVGRWPLPQPHGLLRLCNDYRERGWIGPYISHLRADPWQNPYRYGLNDDGTVALFSMGPDGIANTADDLRPDPAAFDVGTEWTNGWVRATDRLPGVRIYTPDRATTSP